MTNLKVTSEKSYKYRYFREESNRLLLAPFRALAKFTAIAGLFALIFEVRSFQEHSAEVYLARLSAILVAFGLLVVSNTKFGKNHPVALVHILLLTIIGSFGVIIYLIPDTIVFNSHIISLIIFTAALFLSWEVANQIVVAIYYNVVFATSILFTDRAVYVLPNMFESVLLVLFISAMAVAASSINYRLRKDAIFKSFEVAASEKRFRNIFENSAEGIFQESIDGKYIIVNPAMIKMLGYKAQEELKALDVEKDVYKNPEDRKTLIKLLHKQGKVKNYRLVLKRKDGTHIVVKSNVRLITDDDENPLYYEGSLQDITQQVQAEYDRQKALDALKMEKIKADQAASRAIEESGFKTRFLANMSHEVRTPMNSILGYLDLIENGLYEDTEELHTFARSGRMSAQSLLETINNILDLSKIEAGKMELDEVEFSLKKEMEKAISIVSQTAKDKKVNVYEEFDDMIPQTLFGDATRYRQILLNLLANSVKYTENGRIDIKIEMIDQDNDLLVIESTVKDTGQGISKEAQKVLFRPFSQVHSVRSNKQGTGLGLVICKEFCNLMGGDISVESAVGEGSTFTFTVKLGLKPQSFEQQLNYDKIASKTEPVEEIEKEDRITEKTDNGKLRATKETEAEQGDADERNEFKKAIDIATSYSDDKKRVLLVEDNPISQNVEAKLLKSVGYDVDSVSSGEEAIKSAATGRYDVVLMDIEMPGMDGLKATQKIRELESEAKDVPVIAVTAHSSMKDREKCLAAGSE
ncbi:MAG: ATP-binding protein [Melioribacteraceae bacterium]|nr:ATP-binding protein [Melioribacteraceae bacterium]